VEKRNGDKMKLRSIKEVEQVITELAKIEHAIAKKEAQMNAQLTLVRESFEIATAEQNSERKLYKEALETWATGSRLMFQKCRSIEFPSGKLGFRINPPKVVLLNKKYNLKTALELLKRLFKPSYIRTKEEIDKEKILSDYSAKILNDESLAAAGLRVEQEEQFFVEINFEELGMNG